MKFRDSANATNPHRLQNNIWQSPALQSIRESILDNYGVSEGVTTKVDIPPKQASSTSKPGLLPIALWTAPVLLIILTTILLADDRRNLRHLADVLFLSVAPTAHQRAAHPDARRIEDKAPSTPQISLPPLAGKPLIRLGSAKDRCMQLAVSGQENPVYWASDRFAQCTFMYVDTQGGHASVFVQLQTDAAGMVSSFRLKLNTEGTDARIIVQEGLNALRSFGGFFHNADEFLPTIAARIHRWEDFQVLLGPYSLELNREVLDPTRFNLFGRLAMTIPAPREIWPVGFGGTLRQ